MGSGVAAGCETKNRVRTVLYRIIDRECSCKCKGWRLRRKQEGGFCVSFLQHIGVLFESSIFRKQKEADFVLVARKNTLFLTPQSMAMKKSLLILEGNTLANIVCLLGKWSK